MEKKFFSVFNSELLENPPEQFRHDIRQVSGVRTKAFVRELALAWVVIVAAIVTAVKVDFLLVKALCFLIVATRMNVLGLLVHDQAHKLGLRGFAGDVIVNLFAGFPLLIFSVESYARVHLAHHKYYFTDKDPDHLRKQGEVWQVPKSGKELFKLFVKDFFGLNVIAVIIGKNKALNSAEFKRSKPTPIWIRVLFFLTVFSAVTYFNLWTVFLVYWFLPIVTLVQMIVRWGALCEHIYNTPGAKIEDNSPLILTTRLNRILLPNLNFSYHAYHHWHANVAFSELPKIHRIYVKYGMVDESKAFKGYADYFKFILSDRGEGEVLPSENNERKVS